MEQNFAPTNYALRSRDQYYKELLTINWWRRARGVGKKVDFVLGYCASDAGHCFFVSGDGSCKVE